MPSAGQHLRSQIVHRPVASHAFTRATAVCCTLLPQPWPAPGWLQVSSNEQQVACLCTQSKASLARSSCSCQASFGNSRKVLSCPASPHVTPTLQVVVHVHVQVPCSQHCSVSRFVRRSGTCSYRQSVQGIQWHSVGVWPDRWAVVSRFNTPAV